VKYAWIAEQGNAFALAEMCDVLDVSISGYRAWKRGGRPDRKRLTDSQMLALIRAIHAELKGAYGSPRMVRELAGQRLLGQQGTGRTADARQRHPCPPQAALQGHDGLETRPAGGGEPARQKLQADGAESGLDVGHHLPVDDEGWLYLAIVLDLFNREVVGWSLKPRMTADIVTDALTMAWFRKRPAPGLLHHSDRGSQYASHAFQDKLKEYGMTCSMSRKGNCWDNAPTESWFNSFKNERVHGIRYATHADMKAASFRVHRGLLQPETAAFDPRLQVADSVPGELDQRAAASGKTGSMKPTLWQTKNRGNLTSCRRPPSLLR
jgi:putative transposase